MSQTIPSARGPTEPVKLNLRFQERLRARLEDASKASGHSLNSEIVRRLERSLDADAMLDSLSAPSPRTIRFMRRLQSVIALIESATGQSWGDDPPTSAAGQRAIKKLIGLDMPDDPELVAAEAAMKAKPTDTAAFETHFAIEDAYDKLAQRAVEAVVQLVWRHPGHVNDDGSTTPVADLNRS